MQKQNIQPVTKKDLGEFAEDVLLPAIERIIDERVPKIIDERVPKIIDERIDEKVPVMINRAKLELMDHFDDKIADLRGDIILLFRKDDRRFLKLVEMLYEKKVFNQKDIEILQELKLFPAQFKQS